MQRRLLLFLLLSLLAPGPGAAEGRAPSRLVPGAPGAFDADLPESAIARALPEKGVPQLEARLVVSRDPSLHAGVLFDLAPGWHLYWKNPGDTGIAPRLDLRADGYAPGELVWPAPTMF